jgi:outer membrane protein assembly factor BamD
LLLAFGLLACTGSGKNKKVSTYGMKAKQMYLTGVATLKGGSFSEAKKVFEQVKSKFPYSRYATLAELGIADTFFDSEKFLQAIDRYKLFVRLHPSHPRVSYANFRVAFSYYKLRPWSFFILPPAHEKDATTTRQAIRAFNYFLKYHSTDKLVPRAKKYLKECRLQMARHEMYVGSYYAKQGKYLAQAWRMEHLLKFYDKAGLDEKARYQLGEAWYKLKRWKKSQKVFQELVKKNPGSSYLPTAKKRLAQLKVAILSKKKKAIKAKAKQRKAPTARGLPLVPRTTPALKRSTPQ